MLLVGSVVWLTLSPLPKPLVVSSHSVWYCGFDLQTFRLITTFRAELSRLFPPNKKHSFLIFPDHLFPFTLDLVAPADLFHNESNEG